MPRKRIFTENMGASKPFDATTTNPIYEYGRYTAQEDIIIVAHMLDTYLSAMSQNDHIQQGWGILTTQYGDPTVDGVFSRVSLFAYWNTSPAAIVQHTGHAELAYAEDVGISVREGETVYLLGSYHYVPVGFDTVALWGSIQFIKGRAMNQ